MSANGGVGGASLLQERRSPVRLAMDLVCDPYLVLSPRLGDDGQVLDLRVRFANPAACRAFARPLDDLLWASLRDLISDEDSRTVVAGAQYVLATGSPTRTLVESARSTTADGRWREMRVIPMDHHLAVVWVNTPDGLAVKRAVVHQPSRAEFDALGTAVVIHRSDGTIRDCNAAAEAILGVTRDQLLADRDQTRARTTEIVRADRSPLPPAELPVNLALATGRPATGILLGVRRNQLPPRWVLADAVPVGGPPGGPPDSVVATFTDATSLQVAHEHLKAAMTRYGAVVSALREHIYVLEPWATSQDRPIDFVVSQFKVVPDEQVPDPGTLRGPRAACLLSVFYPDSERDGFAAACREVLQTGEEVRIVVHWPWPGADAEYFDITIARYLNERGHCLAVVGQDVSREAAAIRAIAEAEHRLRRSINAMPDLVAIHTAVRDDSGMAVDLRYEYINDAILALVGRPADQVIGHTIREVFPKVSLNQVLDSCLQPLRTGSPTTFRLPRPGPDGPIGELEVTSAAAGEDVIIVARDVSDLAATQRALAESKERFRLIAENASDVVLELTSQQAIAWASPSCQEVLGWSPADLLGSMPWELVHPDDRKSPVARGASGTGHVGLTRIDPVRVRRADGTYIWMAGSTRTIVTGDPGHGQVVSLRDVDELVSSRAQAREERARLKATLDSQLDPHLMLRVVRDAGGQVVDFVITEANSAAREALCSAVEQLVGQPVRLVLPEAMSAGLLDWARQGIDTGEPLILDDVQTWCPNRDHATWLDIRSVRVGEDVSHTWRDVTDRHTFSDALEHSKAQFRLLAENASDLVMRTNTRSEIDWVSPSVLWVLGYAPEYVVGRTTDELVHPDDISALLSASWAVNAGQPVTYRARVRRSDGTYRWMEITARAVMDRHGQAIAPVLSMRDAQEQVRVEQELRRRAHHDDLTGLLNREEALTRLDLIRNQPRQPGSECAVLFIDLDDFKAVNDEHGHGAGDDKLRSLAARCKSVVRDGDLVARLGGDEFLVVLDGVHGLDEALVLAERIRTAAGEPLMTAGPAAGTVTTVSIGVTMLSPGDSVDALVNRADKAMYAAKRGGRNRVVEFTTVEPAAAGFRRPDPDQGE